MASNFSDDARRADILRRAHAGLEEDLDDMRAELMDILPEYEQRLRRRSDALPSWLEITPAQVRALFHLKPVGTDQSAPSQTSPVHGILGPRTVALAAGRIETFIERGFVDVDFGDPSRVRRLVDLYLETTSYLDALIREARRVAQEARTTLDAWLDALLYELESQRKTDVEALEDLVSQGDIGRGGSARQEIADLWEEQRRVAADLQASWQPLSALVREGLASTESGLQELSGLLMRARAGLVGANAAFEAQLPPFVWPATAPAAPPASAETDDAGPTLDLRPPPEVAPGEGAGDASIDTASRDTLVPGRRAENTVPGDLAVGPDEPAHHPQQTLSEGNYIPGIIPLDEPASDPEMPTLESSSVSDYSEPLGEDAGPTPDAGPTARSSTQRMYTRAETPSAGHPAAPEPIAPHADPDPTPRRHTEPVPAGAEDVPATPTTPPRVSGPGDALLSDEATYTQCFRVRPGYARAGWLEILGVTLPPAIVLGTLAILSVLNLAGAGFNPFERWSWAFSAAAGALAWLLLLPALRRWRSKWLGTRLVIMRHTDVREEAALRFDKQVLSLADTTLRWDRLSSAQLRRWDSPLDEVCGWTLSLTGPGAALLLATPEANRKKWQNAPYQLAETPYDAWQVSPFDFDTIVRRAL